jgi:hypothetical protein
VGKKLTRGPSRPNHRILFTHPHPYLAQPLRASAHPAAPARPTPAASSLLRALDTGPASTPWTPPPLPRRRLPPLGPAPLPRLCAAGSAADPRLRALDPAPSSATQDPRPGPRPRLRALDALAVPWTPKPTLPSSSTCPSLSLTKMVTEGPIRRTREGGVNGSR